MWRWLILALVLSDNISSQPVAEDAENVRQTRQSDFECCPCPGSKAFRDFEPVVSSGGSVGGRAEGMDDCPCRVRDADSEGAASVFFPRAMRPLRPFAKPEEELKPLLHPEVGLASSVLETLRAATDEEYQEAVARDTARNTAKTADPDFEGRAPEAGKNIVTIIVKPNSEEDILIPEASNVQQSRYVHPLENSGQTLGQVRAPEHKSSFLDFSKFEPKGPSLRNLVDMHTGASNVEERVANSMNRGLQGLQLKSPSLSNLFQNKGDRNPLNIKDAASGREKVSGGLGSVKVPNFRLSPTLTGLKERINSLNALRADRVKSSLVPKLRINNAQKPEIDDVDNNPSSSIVREQLSEVIVPDSARFGLKSLIPSEDINLNKRPILNHLLKLRDVELIPPKKNKVKIELPALKLTPHLQGERINKNEKLREPNNINIMQSSDTTEVGSCDITAKETGTDTYKQELSWDKIVKTEILDTVPSLSNNYQSLANNENIEILDSVPNAAEKDETEVANRLDDSTIQDYDSVDSEPSQNHVFEESAIANINADVQPEERVDIADSLINDEETIVIENGDSDIVIVVENKPESHFSIGNGDDLSNVDFAEDQNSDQDAFVDTNNKIETLPEQNIANLDYDSVLDSDAATSNHVIQIDPQDDIKIDYPDSENNFRSEESCQDDHANKVESENTPTATAERNDANIDTDTDCVNKESLITSTLLANGHSEEAREELDQINIEDLKHMSNKILDLSNQELEKTHATESLERQTVDNDNIPSNGVTDQKEQNASNVDSNDQSPEASDMERSGTSKNNAITDSNSNVDTQLREISLEENDNDNLSVIDNSKQEADTGINNDKTGRTCSANLEANKKFKENAVQEIIDAKALNAPNEMTVEASAPTVSILPQITRKSSIDASLFPQDVVLQPSSLFSGSNLLKNPLQSIGDLLKKTQLPTLGDIQTKIIDPLGPNQRNDNEDIEIFESAENFSHNNPVMSTDASTRNSKSFLAPLKPQEDINLDIFQINPLSQKKIPSLNLNSFKARLPALTNLDLKPVKLQSSLGKNGNILGATLTFGPERIGSVRKTKGNSIMSLRPSQSLGSSLPNIPSLDELKSTMRSNAQNLLSSPLPVLPTLRPMSSFSTLSDNLRSHTENTMKNIQQTLASTLNEAKIKDVEKYAKPKDMLEDMNDKLQAIHLDLNDRLSSIHDKIVDQSRLSSLNIPVFKESERNLNTKSLKARTNFKTSISSNKPHSNKPASQNKVPFNSERSRNIINEEKKLKPYKISKAASTLTPKNIEVPKLTTTSTKPPFLIPPHRDADVKFKESKAGEKDSLKPQNVRPISRNKYKPSEENKVKASMTTTTRPLTRISIRKPVSPTPKHDFLNKQSQSKHQTLFRNIPEINRPLWSHNLKSLGDSRAFASELKPARVPAPVRLTNNPKYTSNELEDGISSQAEPNSSTILTKPKPPLLSPHPSPTAPQLTVNSFKYRPPKTSERTVADAESASRNVKQTLSERLSQLRQNSGTPVGTKPKPPLLNQSPKPLDSQSNTFKARPTTISEGSTLGTEPFSRKVTPQTVSWPKVTDTSFLTKVKEAVQARFPHLNASKPIKTGPGTDSKVKESQHADDMLRSASENSEIRIEGEPLKENVSYRCRMVCIREPIE